MSDPQLDSPQETPSKQPQNYSQHESYIITNVSAVVASCFARALPYPADTIKSRQQVAYMTNTDHSRTLSTWKITQNIVRKEGFGSLYRGLGVTLLGVLPGTIGYHSGYNLGLQVFPPLLGQWSGFACGITAQLIGGIMFTPIDVLRERLQVQADVERKYGKQPYRGAAQLSLHMLRTVGAKGLMKGYWLQNCVWLPLSSIQLGGQELLRYRVRQSQGGELLWWQVPLCSVPPAVVAVALTNPIDVIKTRFQVAYGLDKSVSIFALARSMLINEGVSGFTAGLGARLLAFVPGICIQWTAFEAVKQQLKKIEK